MGVNLKINMDLQVHRILKERGNRPHREKRDIKQSNNVFL